MLPMFIMMLPALRQMPPSPNYLMQNDFLTRWTPPYDKQGERLKTSGMATPLEATLSPTWR